jgi:hypothetical protein
MKSDMFNYSNAIAVAHERIRVPKEVGTSVFPLPPTLEAFIGSCPPPGTGTIAFYPTFGSFYLIRNGFRLGELVSLVKV